MTNIANSKLKVSLNPKAVFLWLKVHWVSIFVVFLVLVAIGIVYGNDLAIIANEVLQNEAYGHVLFFPFLVGILFYVKRDVIKASLLVNRYRKHSKTDYLNEALGGVICLAALLLYWYGSFTFYPLEFHIASLPFFIMGIVLMLSNPRTLVLLIFPILFIFFLVPLPATFLYTAGGALANFNTQISYNVLKLAGLPITLSTTYGSPTIQLLNASGQPMDFSVDVPCSGIYSLIAFTMFATFLLLISRTSAVKKGLIFLLGFLVFWILNLLRIMGIISVAHWFGSDTALFIHSFAGLVLVFVGMILILISAEKLLKIRVITKTPIQKACPKCETHTSQIKNFCDNCGRYIGKSNPLLPKTTFAKLFILILGCSVAVLSISAPTFATSQNQLELLSATDQQNATSNIFPAIEGYRLSFCYRDTAYEQISHQDASLMYMYAPTNRSNSLIYADIGVASSITNLHNWEVCYVSAQTAQGEYPLVDVLDQQDTQLLPETSLIAKYFIFSSPQNYTQVTLYWFGRAPFKTGLNIEQKYYRISLIIITRNSTAIPLYKEQLFKTGNSIALALEPMKTQALLSLGVPVIQYTLVGVILFIAFTKISQTVGEQRKKNDNLKLFNNYASKKEKIVLQTIKQLSATEKYIKTSDIIENVTKHVGKPINNKRVFAILKTLEQYGLINRTIVSKENIPFLVWQV